jgi:hypothetical protein
MSEFSLSFHIRLDDRHGAEALLLGANLSGILFGPANGWLTFVPYGGGNPYEYGIGDAFAESLCNLTGRPVLSYCYGEDHGWMFNLARPDQPQVKYACWWDPAPSVESDQFDARALADFVALDQLKPVLREFDHMAAAREQPAYRFAELLGLPAYQWLSPHLVHVDTPYFLDRGGREVGTRPPGP